MINFIKNLFKKPLSLPKKVVRERLSFMYVIETDKAKYYAYNTQTVEADCSNIEIEEVRDGVRKIILEKEIIDESYNGLGGSSFYTIVLYSKDLLRDYIKRNGEFIVTEKEAA